LASTSLVDNEHDTFLDERWKIGPEFNIRNYLLSRSTTSELHEQSSSNEVNSEEREKAGKKEKVRMRTRRCDWRRCE
jgi:hypothetical protein